MSEAAARTRSAKLGPKPGWLEIEINLANDGLPVEVFIGGCEEGDFLIKRGEKVVVPPSVKERLDLAVIGVDEGIAGAEGDDFKVVTRQRQRFAYTVHRVF